MFTSLTKIFTANTNNLQDVPGFPYSDWSALQSKYSEDESWINGEALENLISEGGAQADLYPMRINPLPSAVAKHVATLLGEYEDDGRPQVYPRIIPPSTEDKAQKETFTSRALEIEEILNILWMESAGRSLMLQNGLLSQIYGGCIFKSTYVPWEKWPAFSRTYPLRVEAPHPKEFVGYPSSGNQFILSEAWIVHEWTRQQAAEYGYAGEDDNIFGVEKWTPNEYAVYLDGKIATKSGVELHGVNRFGFVPIVYIPHIRYVNFYGVNLAENVKNILKELNRTWGDLGDAINDDAHPINGMRNVTGNPVIRKISEWLTVVDIGNKQGMGTSEGNPDLFQVGQTRASSTMTVALESIYKQFRRDAYIPPVADGEDEGSQRSAMTLDVRFWPLISHTKMERVDWTSGLNLFDSMLLRMLAVLKIGGITEEETRWRMKQKWSPQLPRDRTSLVDELVKRAEQEIASIDTILESSGDIEDVQMEKERLLEWKRKLQAIKTEAETTLQELKNEGTVAAAEAQAVAFQQSRPADNQSQGGGQ